MILDARPRRRDGGQRARMAAGVALLVWALALCAAGRPSTDAETRVIDYLRTHVEPGQPMRITELYNQVFTRPDERQALNKLYNAFFRIPLFVAQYQQRFSKPPSLATIASQFDLHAPGAADVLLRVMEADPRVPKFLTRDPKTGAITHVDVAAIRNDPRFGQSLEHQLGGWNGKPAPPIHLERLGGGEIDSAALRGKPVLLYVWFTGCPPCMEEAPRLVRLARQCHDLTIVGANADKLLGLGYDDTVRQRYVQEHQINFPIADWTREANTAYGDVAIFPTLFLIDRQGVIRQQWVGLVSEEQLRQGVKALP